MLRKRDLGHIDFLKNCFHLVQDLGEGSRVVKKLPRCYREMLREKP